MRYEKGGYDEEANRFITEVENPGLSETQDNRLRLIVEDPDTGRPAIAFSALID